ncbi:hypothetical protein NW752_006893 [Fusarium irregulare]|nr:hypothetical protein NW752_006893 [Fusarium irregulare]
MSSHTKREDDEPPRPELATQEIAEETTAASLYQQIVDSTELDKKLLAYLQKIIAIQKEIESVLKQVIAEEQKVASSLQAVMPWEEKLPSVMEEAKAIRATLESTGQWVATTEEWWSYQVERIAESMEMIASQKTLCSSTKEELAGVKRTLREKLYEASLKQASIAKAILDLGEVNVFKEEH